ncbi:hypothetical protein D3C75_1154150 [compost metagenome]
MEMWISTVNNWKPQRLNMKKKCCRRSLAAWWNMCSKAMPLLTAQGTRVASSSAVTQPDANSLITLAKRSSVLTYVTLTFRWVIY